MGLRKSIYLIRLVLLLICFQFTAASLVTVESVDSSSHISLAASKVSKPITLSSLFEKTEKEEEEKERGFVVDVPDFSFFNFNQFASVQTRLRTDIISCHIQKPSLQRLYCIFLI
jgi:hypothetical protein